MASIYDQKFKDIFVIVVDDRSSDCTKNKLNSVYPQVLVLPGTGSVNFGINYVLSVCQENDWILLMNNDVQMTGNVIDK